MGEDQRPSVTPQSRVSIWCQVCELWLVKRRSPNKAKKVSNQHGAATGHEMEAMVEDED